MTRDRVTAAELMAQLESDPDWVAQRVKADAERASRAAVLSAAEQPILEELRAAGYSVTSVWELHRFKPYPAAIPMLLRHLERGGYPDRVMESLGRALAVREARSVWPQLEALYRRATGSNERQGLAAAISATAGRSHFDELAALIADESLDETRVLFLSALKRIDRQRALPILVELRSHPILGTEARSQTPEAKPKP